ATAARATGRGRAAAPGSRTSAGPAAPPARPSRRGSGLAAPAAAPSRAQPSQVTASQVTAARPAPAAATATAAAALPGRLGAAARSARMPFVLLILALLGGGLICLLVINTTLAASSLRIDNLQQGNVLKTQQEQQLRQQVASEGTPAAIARRAYQLGMRQQQRLDFLDLRTGRSYTQPTSVPGVPLVPGWTP
ncbi:MAG: hypothetical protein ACLP7J_28460, partial [Streptosporangiaceae bacterium]